MWRDLIADEEFWQGVQNVLAAGIGELDADAKKIIPRGKAMALNANWIFFGNSNPTQDCYLWHTIMFDFFKFVPDFCRFRCYKVVVKIRNVAELIEFSNFANALPAAKSLQYVCPIHGKCGIDQRDYSDIPYDAFFYCDGLEHGLEIYNVVRKAVTEWFDDGENIDVILKRSCTEFERDKGPTNNEYWNTFTEDDRRLQNRLEDIFDGFKRYPIQADWHKNRIILRWIKFANMFGDKSWVDYYGGNDFLTMKAVTYHHLLNEGGDKAKRKSRKAAAKGRKRNAKGQFT